MKKRWLIGLILLLMCSLVACGPNPNQDTQKESETETQKDTETQAGNTQNTEGAENTENTEKPEEVTAVEKYATVWTNGDEIAAREVIDKVEALTKLLKKSGALAKGEAGLYFSEDAIILDWDSKKEGTAIELHKGTEAGSYQLMIAGQLIDGVADPALGPDVGTENNEVFKFLCGLVSYQPTELYDAIHTNFYGPLDLSKWYVAGDIEIQENAQLSDYTNFRFVYDIKKHVISNSLEADKLTWFETEFFNNRDNDIVNMFLNCTYKSPKEIDAHAVFEGGCSREINSSVTDAEKALLESRCNAMTNFGVQKAPVAEMNKLLQKYARVTLDEVDKSKLERFYYLEEYDAYYATAGDTNLKTVDILDGWTNTDGTITLVYCDKMNSQDVKDLYHVTLMEENGSYYFLSNVQQIRK